MTSPLPSTIPVPQQRTVKYSTTNILRALLLIFFITDFVVSGITVVTNDSSIFTLSVVLDFIVIALLVGYVLTRVQGSRNSKEVSY